MSMLNVQHITKPQDVIRNYYQEKFFKSASDKKPDNILIFARSSYKHFLRELYYKEYLLKLWYYEIARKNSYLHYESTGPQ